MSGEKAANPARKRPSMGAPTGGTGGRTRAPVPQPGGTPIADAVAGYVALCVAAEHPNGKVRALGRALLLLEDICGEKKPPNGRKRSKPPKRDPKEVVELLAPWGVPAPIMAVIGEWAGAVPSPKGRPRDYQARRRAILYFRANGFPDGTGKGDATIYGAAKYAGVTEGAIRKWLDDPAFRAECLKR